MVRRLIRGIGQALGRRSRTCTTASVMRRWCTPTAASVPIASTRNAGRSTIRSCMPIASRALANKELCPCRAAATGITAEPLSILRRNGSGYANVPVAAFWRYPYFRNDLAINHAAAARRPHHRRAGGEHLRHEASRHTRHQQKYTPKWSIVRLGDKAIDQLGKEL